MHRERFAVVGLAGLLVHLGGCSRITAHNLDPSAGERDGIPFYLPKPYLVVSKNFRHIPTPTVGLTRPAAVPDSFDANARELQIAATLAQSRTLALERKLQEQTTREEKNSTSTTVTIGQANTPAATGDKGGAPPAFAATPGANAAAATPAETKSGEPTNPTATPAEMSGVMAGMGQVLGPANVGVTPSGSLPDGLTPEVFYTYQILYLPDLTQKYGLEIHNGPGEFRATMNLVNGWMNTGAGPIYMKDSTTAANTVATGMAVSDVIDSVASLGFAGAAPAVQGGGVPAAELLRAMSRAGETLSEGFVAGTKRGRAHTQSINNYAEIYVFELKKSGWELLPKMPIGLNRDFIGEISQETQKTSK